MTRFFQLQMLVAVGAMTLAACGSDPAEPPMPATIQVDSSTVSFVALGDTRQLAATVLDEHGQPIAEPALEWSTADSAVAVVSASGLVSAIGPGSTQVTVRSGPASADVSVQVTQAPAQIMKVSGDGQSGPPGQSLTSPLDVQVNDARGNPVAGVVVQFTRAAGSAAIASPTVTTGADGRAGTALTPVDLGTQQITASVDGTGLSALFTVTAVSGFHIEVRFLTAATASQRQALSVAAERWQSLVVGDVPDALLDVAAGTCGAQSPAVNEQIDDVVILVSLVEIDGPGRILGQAGPCFIRQNGGLPLLGLMRLDSDDLNTLENRGVLEDVILHEMGHVLGIGSLWETRQLLADPSLEGGADPHFTGSQTIQAFDQVGGTAYTGGEKVPVENMFGPGTADAHWRESVLDDELMTGFVNLAGNRLSRVTIASLADEGYVVNLLGADDYSLAPGLRARVSGPTLRMERDMLMVPVGVVTPDGRVTAVIRP